MLNWLRNLMNPSRALFDILIRVEDKLDLLLVRSHLWSYRMRKMANELDALTVEVDRNTSVDASVKALLVGLAAKIEGMKGNPAALQALVDTLKRDNDALAEAVVANTPADENASLPGANT